MLHSSISGKFIVHPQHSANIDRDKGVLETTCSERKRELPKGHMMDLAADTRQMTARFSATPRASLSLRWKARLDRNRRFRRTLSELNALSDRELADLGMSRSMLRSVAWESSAKD